MEKYDVILTRFSTDMQRSESCDDQEREVKAVLKRLGVPLTNPLFLRDEAESGTKLDRDAFVRAMNLVKAGRVRVLAVDDQSRFSRADQAYSLINDVVFHGGRFISTGENIDTDEEGWQLKVKVMELHNSTTVRELARRVRRGQKGRVLDGNGSAGDFCFGYCSQYIESNWAELLATRGPKPKKIVVVYEPEAEIVRLVFLWFVDGLSIGAIARRLNDMDIAKGPRCTTPHWAHQHVRKILGNTKYIGEWHWGRTISVRDSQGRKRQVPAKQDQMVDMRRPELRIIDDATWKKSQVLLAELLEIYGKKPGQKSRAAKVHHTEVYPVGLLNGLIWCEKCGARMTAQLSGKYRYFGCSKHRKGVCDVGTRVRIDIAEEKIISSIGDIFGSIPDWMKTVIDTMRNEIDLASSQIPAALIADRKRLAQIERGIANLVNAVEQGLDQSSSIVQRLGQLEREAASLREQIEEREDSLNKPIAMPDDDWIRSQLADQVSLLQEFPENAALMLRQLIGKITAHEIKIRGKKRGYMELRFRIDAFRSISNLLGDTVSPSILQSLNCVDDSEEHASPEFVIAVGGPSRMDQAAPQIVSLRNEGVSWNEIGRLLNMSPGGAWTVWKRWTEHDRSNDAA
ncbi:MAG TPA: recombinase family protein [Phycisphaerae bacterium]|nr:recombinase family protein [Phycisphaerae bacterium]